MLIKNAEIAGERKDLRWIGDKIVELGQTLSASPNEETIDAGGGALLRGLHDHHLHLLSLAAALGSVACGPPEVQDADELARRLAAATPRNGWLRGTGYFESVAGELDRARLDALSPGIPLRIQHRSGSMWFLNSPAIAALDLGKEPLPEGVERDSRGQLTGRLFRADAWLRDRLPRSGAPDLAIVGERLARFGVTGITDATPTNAAAEFALLRAAQESGALPQRVRVMGALALSDLAEAADSPRSNPAPRMAVDAHKILLDEPALPDLDTLTEALQAAHRHDRGVAVHTVTRAELLFALAAFATAGTHPGDRLEHASVAPPEAMDEILRLGLRVCTQPNFIAERGDAYQRNVAQGDQPHLYRVRSWTDRKIPLAFGTDAPFGNPDPWHAMRAAVHRETPSGATLGGEERVTPETALALFDSARLGPAASSPVPRAESEAPRAPEVGDPADLCLLGVPWSEARTRLLAEDVLATICAGTLVYQRRN